MSSFVTDVWFLSLVICVASIDSSLNTNNGNVLVVKCCPLGEQLNGNLTKCELISTSNSSSAEVSYINVGLGDISLNSTINRGQDINASAENEIMLLDKVSWLPEQLRRGHGSEPMVIFGRQNNCSNTRTVSLKSPNDDNLYEWLPNGSLVLHSSTVLGSVTHQLFDPQDFCTDSFTDEIGDTRSAILLCPCQRVPCLTKCCPVGQAVVCSEYTCDCGDSKTEWKPFHQVPPSTADDFPFEIVFDHELNCAEGYTDLVYVFESYPLFLHHRFWMEMLTDEKICGDIVVGLTDAPSHGMMKCNPEIPFLTVYVFANWLHVPEAVFLALSLLTTFIVPRRRLSAYSYVHDMSLVWHTASLFTRCLLWSVFLKAKWSCSHIPIFIYFFSVAASFWLNVLCLNMTCGFWKPLGLQQGRWGGARGMLLWYSAYAWGASAALTVFTAMMWYSREVPGGLLRPTLHETRTCFREEEGDGKIATFAYYYGPIGSLLCVNALLFSSTALRVRRLRQNTAVLNNRTSSVKNSSFGQKRSVIIYIKLLWLMGVMEMAVEAVAWLSNSNEYYFAIAGSCLDMVRAVAIFVLCCCKRRTLLALRDRLCACALLRRWRSRRSPQDIDLPHVGDGLSKTTSEMSSTTDVTVCDCDVVSRTE